MDQGIPKYRDPGTFAGLISVIMRYPAGVAGLQRNVDHTCTYYSILIGKPRKYFKRKIIVRDLAILKFQRMHAHGLPQYRILLFQVNRYYPISVQISFANVEMSRVSQNCHHISLTNLSMGCSVFFLRQLICADSVTYYEYYINLHLSIIIVEDCLCFALFVQNNTSSLSPFDVKASLTMPP